MRSLVLSAMCGVLLLSAPPAPSYAKGVPMPRPEESCTLPDPRASKNAVSGSQGEIIVSSDKYINTPRWLIVYPCAGQKLISARVLPDDDNDFPTTEEASASHRLKKVVIEHDLKLDGRYYRFIDFNDGTKTCRYWVEISSRGKDGSVSVSNDKQNICAYPVITIGKKEQQVTASSDARPTKPVQPAPTQLAEAKPKQ